MSRPIIEIQNLSKRYNLGAIGATSLREETSRLWDRLRGRPHPDAREFWALRDVSFDVQPGEVVGVIGRNGAGKSTLLKILSRITEPTQGSARLRGRVASLLEVGTGFHPELTGRENVFLNGAILGMTRAEVRQKFDEIVAFAEVEQFIDTPVKRYSSGMYVRLAFAVAAHLEPEILIVDEVLAVGDAQFQKKCLGKMQDVSRGHGRTILFVSHNLTAVRELTRHCVYLQNGGLRGTGDTKAILDLYTADTGESTTVRRGVHASVLRATLVDDNGHENNLITSRDPMAVIAEIQTDGHATSSVECYLTDANGMKLALASPSKFHDWLLPSVPGVYRVQLPLRFPPMASGPYFIDVCTTTEEGGFDHYQSSAIRFEVAPGSHRPGGWDFRNEYQAGYFVFDHGVPKILRD